MIPRRPRSQRSRRRRSSYKPVPARREEAFAFLMLVKGRFKDNPEIYDQFLTVSKDFKEKRIDIVGLRSRVEQLLKGHLDLLVRFNTFLPKEYQIKLPKEYDNAVKFVKKIEMRFANDRQRYVKFQQIIDGYRTGTKSIKQLTKKVMTIFAGHLDLQFEFVDYYCP